MVGFDVHNSRISVKLFQIQIILFRLKNKMNNDFTIRE